jgi:hypothetical protein
MATAYRSVRERAFACSPVRPCEATVAGVHAMVSEIRELAASYREEGKRYFLQIEECSLTTSEVRTVCEALKKKIAKNIAA